MFLCKVVTTSPLCLGPVTQHLERCSPETPHYQKELEALQRHPLKTMKEVGGLIWEETASEYLGKVMTKTLCWIPVTFMGGFKEVSVGS